MTKAKKVLMVALLLSGSFSHAGFECEENAGKLSVTAEHEDSAYDFKGNLGKVEITTSGKDKIKMSAQASKWSTRVGSQYTYKLPVDGILFSVSEFTNLVKNPDCHPGGRITCDYDWSSSYVGYLTFNGKSYELHCQAL